MLMKRIALAALAGTALLATAPAFADNYRGDRHNYRGSQFQGNHFRGGHFQWRPVGVHRPAYRNFGHRPVGVHRPAYRNFGYRPVVVQRPAYGYSGYPSHNVIGGLILGTVIGAAIANHAGY